MDEDKLSKEIGELIVDDILNVALDIKKDKMSGNIKSNFLYIFQSHYHGPIKPLYEM